MVRRSILVVDDEVISAAYLRDLLSSLDCEVEIAENGEVALERLSQRGFDLVITDLVMPGIDGFALVKRARKSHPLLPIHILTAHGSAEANRKAELLGADEFLQKPLDPAALHLAVSRAFERPRSAPAPLDPLALSMPIIGSSEPMQRVLRLLHKARHSRGHVLIRGESGTGKELVARAIVEGNDRRGGPFVVVNCCAISEGLIESELFGHARGAFSGAVTDREGLFENADGGTIFLDEIGDLPPQSQTKLLRILQEGELRRVGENRVRRVDVRVIAATHRNLEAAIKTGAFRADLFYRLNVIPVVLPPLRARKADIPHLVQHFLEKHQAGQPRKVGIAPEALQLLSDYAFPGNIRELENLIHRAISFASGSLILKEEIAIYLETLGAPAKAEPGFPSGPDPEPGRLKASEAEDLWRGTLQGMSYSLLKRRMTQLEKDFLLEKLKACRGSVSEAARLLEVTRTALHNKMKRLGLGPADYRP